MRRGLKSGPWRVALWAATAILAAPGLSVLWQMSLATAHLQTGLLLAALGAILNTLLVVGLSSAVALGLGIPAGYRFWREPWPLVGKGLDAMGAMPAILAGLFGLRVLVGTAHLGYSLLAGGLTLGLLNLPAAVRLAEAAFAESAPGLLAAALALGQPEGLVYRRLLRPAATPALRAVGRLLAARAAGEAAVLMLTAGVAQPRLGWPDLWHPGGTLAVHIWYLASQGEGRGVEATLFTVLLMLMSLAFYLMPLSRGVR